jgi:multiple sugar transport system ATP-binding protein
MNLVEGSLAAGSVTFGQTTLPLDRGRRPGSVESGSVIVGIRPEAFEDAEFASGDLPQMEVKVEVLEELGSDAFVFFALDAEGVVIEDALSDDADDETTLLAAERNRTLFTARVDPRTKARVGDMIRLAVDPSRFYFFAPETGETLLGDRTLAAAGA